MEFDTNNYNEFSDIYSGLEPPKIPIENSNLQNQQLGGLDFLENLDYLNSYQSFSSQFPGLEAPQSLNTKVQSLTNFTNLSQPQESTNKQQIKLKGSKQFEEALAKAEQINPNVRKYRNFLIKTAKLESGFNSHIQNKAGAPYYGYFQMGREEIKRTTGLSVNDFRNDPIQQILGAVKLYEINLKTIKVLGIYEKCKSAGYSDDAIIAGAWVGGPGGVKRFINRKGDPSDSHWYNGSGGTSVGKRMKEFNNYA